MLECVTCQSVGKDLLLWAHDWLVETWPLFLGSEYLGSLTPWSFIEFCPVLFCRSVAETWHWAFSVVHLEPPTLLTSESRLCWGHSHIGSSLWSVKCVVSAATWHWAFWSVTWCHPTVISLWSLCVLVSSHQLNSYRTSLWWSLTKLWNASILYCPDVLYWCMGVCG